MSTTKLQLQTRASTIKNITQLGSAQAVKKHTDPTSLLLEECTSTLVPGVRPPRITVNKPKQLLNFCPICSMLLRAAESNPTSLKCKKCGYRAKLENKVLANTKRSHQPAVEIAVIDKQKGNLRTNTTVKVICEKCGETESEAWTIAIGSEGTTSALTFLRCVKCGYTHREVG